MTFPITHMFNTTRNKGEYRGYYLWSTEKVRGHYNQLKVHERSIHIQSPVPTPPIGLEKWSWRGSADPFSWTPTSSGAVPLGDPDFDRSFAVYGEPALVRHIMNDGMVAWLKSINWVGGALLGLSKIDFGADPITIAGEYTPLVCQHRVNFVIDFLSRTPRDSWPATPVGPVIPA